MISAFGSKTRRRIDESPHRYLIALFAAFILSGTALLSLPMATVGEVGFVDIFFTATSAACVTGLMTVDAGTAFTPFGQGVILLLIQVGGLGIMTFGVFFMSLLGGEVSLRDSSLVVESMSHRGEVSLGSLIGRLMVMVFCTEALGTAALYALWSSDMPTGEAFWMALFHAVSAFCNAGISLYPDSLVRYAADPWVNGVFIGLIVMGGLGFVTVVEVYVYGFGRTIGGRKMTRLSLQARIILAATAIFAVGGAAATMAMEWNHALGHLPPEARPLAALFHSVTCRTAGFNTIDTMAMGNGMIFFTLLLMFVGGAPGSAAGGIKVTTFAALVALAYARYRGWERPMLFHRSIPRGVVDRAVAILSISTLIVALFCMGLMITETTVGDDWDDRGRFVAILFESVSAFGTVGLSMGETPELSTAGKILVTSLMFIGRLGSLTVAMAVARRSRRGAYQYAEENVMVG